MSYFLDEMRKASHARLEAARNVASLEIQRRRAEGFTPHDLEDGFHVFAEVKPVSPAEGDLVQDGFAQLAESYVSGGASALSVLTEPTRFGGSLELLEELAARVTVPVMRKDFILDPYQVWEGRAHGASGVLAIARMLDDEMLDAVVAAARDAELFVLLEAFDRDDLDRISDRELDPGVLVGVNSRDLDTLEVRRSAHADLFEHVPEGCVAIAESGIETPEQVSELREIGYEGVLVGTSLMRSADPGSAVAAMVAAGKGDDE